MCWYTHCNQQVDNSTSRFVRRNQTILDPTFLSPIIHSNHSRLYMVTYVIKKIYFLINKKSNLFILLYIHLLNIKNTPLAYILNYYIFSALARYNKRWQAIRDSKNTYSNFVSAYLLEML